MKTAIILHGICDTDEYYNMDFPSPSNAHWIPWLQQKFLRAGVLCQALEMPTPPAPRYADWEAVFHQVKLDADSVVVAHSAGCGFILKWLTQHPQQKLARLVLVAPWADLRRKHGDFLECRLPPQLMERVGRMDVLYSANEDTDGVSEAKDMILKTYPAALLHMFEDKGHFCFGDIGTHAFPELWDICCA